MTPFFFGNAGKELFGLYEPPRGRTGRNEGVVLCYPAPQEYTYSHWIFAKLAGQLSRAGLHVLRFDYFATGDSTGESHAVSLAQCQNDIVTAAQELTDMAGISKLSIVGMRVGATLAATVAANEKRFSSLVLWDPVVDGATYVDELRTVHQSQRVQTGPDELLGFPFSPALMAETRALNLCAISSPKVDRISLLVSATSPQFIAFRDRLMTLHNHVDARVIHDDAVNPNHKAFDESLLARAIPQAIVATLAGAPQ